MNSAPSLAPRPDDEPPAVPGRLSPLRVGFVLLDQFTLAAFGGLIDALRLAADHGGRSRQIHASWTVMSLDGTPRRASCGVVVSDSAPLLDPAQFDYIAVCGGNDYLNEHPPAALLDYLRRAAACRARLIGVCTGTFAIAQAGLAARRTVCIHWNVLEAFQAQFPTLSAVTDKLFVDEGDLLSCAGSTAAIDLGLYLVTRHCGAAKANQAVRHMMLQGMRPPSLPQPHFVADLAKVTDARVHQAVHFMEQRLDDPPSMDAVARYVGCSTRQLERAFAAALGIAPAAFQRQLRTHYACWMLENSPRSITEIAFDCGFSDAAHFSREFRNAFAASPRQYRSARLAARKATT
ncbi:Transcriptional regulator GlxA family, contains an amidase domain and an AraC-type DNA-binding HTH domain [Ancylobacter rudongensis]|uniref:Transcriptional regulator GlxA family, contains an amidase domain and an AraC-type DNA-binding HTH domain n=2 Tax=Ancylobacter rudongensis TaxID=177413 RepID=A0A1G4SEM4_9HYPH|nr:Transcriptional regulator GlxA family, contains an amidase domain and an AraC-type DNA-binding HTH domain [Ancylobacter rudongensis]